ncbi:MAG TPA: aldehyde dehydrogenase family protein [Anaeromyxobacteraceae bacterium]|jgi:aldehyde dehydrogenase (NAD(P)+)
MTAAAGLATRPTERRRLDEAVDQLREGARSWATAPLEARIALARSVHRGLWRVAAAGVEAACRAKALDPSSAAAGEEWISGPFVNLRFARQVAESLESLAARGTTPTGRLSRSSDGRLVERLFPDGAVDGLVFMGIAGEVHYRDGVGEPELRAARGRFHREPDHRGRVCLVLGAGNVNSIPVADVLTKMFNEGAVCVLKCNPVNGYVGPLVEEAFREAVDRGWLRVVYGGGEEGGYLAHHPGVDEVHITGSDRTHDAIVWGPPGPERAARLARDEPLLRKPISSELGNVTPVLVAPGPWSEAQLATQAENVAGMVVHNASFNCIAGKMLILPRGWRHRERFLDLVLGKMGLAPARRAWYPGAFDRYRDLVAGRAVRTAGGGDGALPWTLLPGLDASDREERAFRVEPFCSLLSETAVGSDDPAEFLDAAVRFANERLWGTLSAAVIVHPATARGERAALDRAVRDLRYGSVCLNLWPGFGYAAGTLPWGAFPGSTLRDVQSGRGFVHDTRMVGAVAEKAVMRAPVRPLAKLPYFPSHRTALELGRRLAALQARGWTELPGVVAAGIRG